MVDFTNILNFVVKYWYIIMPITIFMFIYLIFAVIKRNYIKNRDKLVAEFYLKTGDREYVNISIKDDYIFAYDGMYFNSEDALGNDVKKELITKHNIKDFRNKIKREFRKNKTIPFIQFFEGIEMPFNTIPSGNLPTYTFDNAIKIMGAKKAKEVYHTKIIREMNYEKTGNNFDWGANWIYI